MIRTEDGLRACYAAYAPDAKAEERLLDWIGDQGPGPANAHRGARHRRHAALAATIALVVAVAIAVVVVGANHHRHNGATQVSPFGPTFITVREGSPGHGFTVQLRSRRHGHLIKNVYTSKALSGAAQLSDRAVLVADAVGCRTQLITINLASGRRVPLATLPGSVNDLAVSPNGSRIAYMTNSRPACNTPAPCPSTCEGSGVQLLPPNVLVIRSLRSGKSVRLETAANQLEGRPLLSDLSWSPDGRQIAADYGQPLGRVVLLDSDHPAISTATSVPAPPGCYYYHPAWTTEGIDVAAYCGKAPIQLTGSRIVQVDAHGVVSARWSLPGCLGDISTQTGPRHRTLLVRAQVDAQTCFGPPETWFLTSNGHRLRHVLTVSYPGGRNHLVYLGI